MLVYKITNLVNGKVYIGLTQCSIKKRWREHVCAANQGNNSHLYRAMRKHGISNFLIEVIYEADSIEDMKAAECRLIAENNSYVRMGGGYNLTLGGDGLGNLGALCGEDSSASILTEAIVAFIRNPDYKDMSNKTMVSMVSDKFGRVFNIDTLKDARNGSGWKHLNEKYPPIKVKKGARKPPMSKERRTKNAENLAKYHLVSIEKAKQATRGRRPSREGLLEKDTVYNIFNEPLSLQKIADKYGVCKKTALNIKKRRCYVYWTKDF